MRSLSTKIFNSVASINNFVFSIVPCTVNPYTGNAFRQLDNPVPFLLNEFVNHTMSGWCSLNAEFMSMILKLINFPCHMYNYGIPGSITHATVIVKIDENEYLFDPYFNKYYTYKNEPVSFTSLMSLIEKENVSEVASIYGPSLKFYDLDNDIKGYIDGQTYEKRVIDNHIKKRRLNEILIEKFGNTNLFNLMRSVL